MKLKDGSKIIKEIVDKNNRLMYIIKKGNKEHTIYAENSPIVYESYNPKIEEFVKKRLTN